MKICLENIIFVAIFFLLILIIIVKIDCISTISERENRALATFPNVSIFHEKFPKKFDEYVNDRVGFKFEALLIVSQVLPISVRQNPKSKVLIGKDNWLFYNSDGETLEDFQRVDHFSETELERIKNVFTEVNEFAKRNGIALYIIVPPIKHNVHPEFYLDGINQLPIPSKYETVRNYIKGTDIPLVDLMEPLNKGKKDRALYFLSDEHWNYYGGYIAYFTLMNEIKKKFPSIYIISKDKFVENNNHLVNGIGQLERILGSRDFYYKDWHNILYPVDNVTVNTSITTLADARMNAITETTNIKGPKAFIVHDSFIGAMDYINKSFSRAVSKWEWGVSPMKYKDEILKEKPDILIWEIHERYLSNIIK